MSRSSTPGFPAGRHSAPHGNRARSFDYPQEELRDDEPYDPSLLTGPGQGGVGVFQAPRPSPGRGTPPVESAPAAPMLVGDGTDIDSPFLDLFGGGPRPGATPSPGTPARRGAGREHRPVPHQPAPTPPPAIEAQAPAAAIEAAPPAARTRVPHQQGDRSTATPTGDRPAEAPQRAPRRVPTDPFPRDTGEPLTAREAAERARREATERAREASDRARREAAERARREAAEQAAADAARREAAEAAHREAVVRAEREAAEAAHREAVAQAEREAAELARREAAEAARREAAERGRREAAEQARRENAGQSRRDATLTPRPR
ncbi:hypothetical protein AB0K29_29845, partial [Micromonospora humida]